MTNYKAKLKEEMLKSLKELCPSNKMEYSRETCPECNKKNTYLHYPEYKYGRCNDCCYEVGFEYYGNVMGQRIKVYDELKSKIKKVLEEF